VHWHNRPPLNSQELVAEDVKFTFDRFLTEKRNPLRFMLEPVDRAEVADRHTVKLLLEESFGWLINVLANPTGPGGSLIAHFRHSAQYGRVPAGLQQSRMHNPQVLQYPVSMFV
jgi:ABC-type transport system substrate-binding protein